ncbi:MAG: glycosyltransferase family 1 protein [Desulfosporosinus sp.]|nr:glycosyltransferase family 1 protein [Desulfosporosinus sp.]
MKVLIDAQSIGNTRAGIGNYTYNLLQAFVRMGCSADVSIAVHKDPKALSGLFPQLNMVEAGRNLYKYLPVDVFGFSKSFDVYHEPNYVPRPFSGATLTNIFDMSYVLFPQYHPWKRVQMLRFYEKRMRSADRIITASQSAKGEIVDLLKVPEDKIVVTPLGVSTGFSPLQQNEELLQTVRKRYNLPEQFLLYVGTIEPRKNLERLIEALSIVKEKLGKSSVGLVLAGGKGWLNGPIYRRVQELKLLDDVTFTGYVSEEDLPILYNMALAFVYPSLYEGFGLPPLEAMACGVPVITSKVSSLPEVVGDAGILIDPYNVEELSDAILQVVSSAELRKSLSDKGIKQASLFTWEKCARETLTIYEECFQLRK